MNAEPYVTFVSYFRNDNYTSDFVLRVRRATRFLVGQLQRAALESEVILVEWNPPPGRPLIVESRKRRTAPGRRPLRIAKGWGYLPLGRNHRHDRTS